MTRPVRIANCSGFYGDRLAAAREMLTGPVDVLTGDYLAELTMLILWKARQKDPGLGYATTFLRQLEEVLGTCLERGVKVVANAGGLNPGGLASKITELSGRLGLNTRVAYLTGDDLIPALGDLQAAGHEFVNLDTGLPLAKADRPVVTANAYLGGWGITAALQAGADVVVCPRVTDASLVTGPAAWWHGWRRNDWDALAGAVAAGHVIECGPQACGGNYSFPAEITNRRYPGFPIAEVAADGSSVITKHDGTGGVVSVGTVTAQLLYEIGEPAYLNPDVVTHFDTFYERLPNYYEFFRWNTLLYVWISLGIVKVIHEFGHGLSCKAFGGECHEMGALFLCLSPCLYCNVSDSWTLPNKWRRIIISFAGIYVELVIAESFIIERSTKPPRYKMTQVDLAVVFEFVNDVANDTAAAVGRYCRVEVNRPMRTIRAAKRSVDGSFEGL